MDIANAASVALIIRVKGFLFCLLPLEMLFIEILLSILFYTPELQHAQLFPAIFIVFLLAIHNASILHLKQYSHFA
jgi:hypothetical protein